MRVAYADPPYIGQARRHYSDDPRCAEVDHGELITRLMRDYDAWALSLSSVSLWTITRLQDDQGRYIVPEDARICAWVKPFASFKPGVNPAYAWEPVIFYGGRNRGKSAPTVRDWVSANITMQRGTHGAKPQRFCFWLFDLLGMDLTDTFDDLYPGSGAVSAAWDLWRRRNSAPVRAEQMNIEQAQP